MKNKKRLKLLERQLERTLALLDKICRHLGLNTGVSLANFDNMLKQLYPADSIFTPKVHPARTELDQESRISRAEEIAAKMFEDAKKEDAKLPNKYETIIETIEFKEEPKEAKIRIPPNLQLGF